MQCCNNLTAVINFVARYCNVFRVLLINIYFGHRVQNTLIWCWVGLLRHRFQACRQALTTLTHSSFHHGFPGLRVVRWVERGNAFCPASTRVVVSEEAVSSSGRVEKSGGSRSAFVKASRDRGGDGWGRHLGRSIFFRIHSCREESLRYWSFDMMWRASWSVLSQAERQTREMRRFAVERRRGRGAMFTSDKAILTAVSTTSLPRTPVCEGTHWKMMFQPSVLRWRRLRCVA